MTTERFTPLLFAAVMAWILCVCVHEFAHAIVAYFGGDTSVRDKGYLTLDPTRFIDPVYSLLVPAVVLILGGIPLPGGSVLIDESGLKNRRWSIAVSAAGPASNFLLFLLFSLPLHPVWGLVDPWANHQPTWVYFCGAMAILNFVAMLLNLLPVPPLDGYHIIEHWLSAEMQFKMRRPQNAMLCFGALFLIFMMVDGALIPFWTLHDKVAAAMGLPIDLMSVSHDYVLFNDPPG